MQIDRTIIKYIYEYITKKRMMEDKRKQWNDLRRLNQLPIHNAR